jgi:hypothetical protein
MPDRTRLTTGEIVILGAGVVVLLFSFFDFYAADFGGSATVWTSGLFPIATLPVFFVVTMAVQVALTKLVNLRVAPSVGGFTWPQLHVILGFFAVVNAVAWLVRKKGISSFGIGFWLILFGSIAALVGAVMLQRERPGGGTGY